MTDTPSARVHAHLVASASVDFAVVHIGDEKCPLPYAIVRQSGGDRQMAEVDIECYDKTPAAATAAAEKVRLAMKYANLGGTVPSLKMWSELYVVPPDGVARTAIGLRYNLPVYQET